MSVLDLMDATTPDEREFDDTPAGSEYSCEICGAPLEYGGRGRKPTRCEDHKRKTAAKPRSSAPTGDVRSALAVMESMYGAVSLGLLMVSPQSASVWGSQIESLQASNALVLAGDKALCKSICRLGERSGKAMFFSAHVMAAVPVAIALQQDFKSRPKKAKPSTQEVSDWSFPETGETVPSDAPPNFARVNPKFDLS